MTQLFDNVHLNVGANVSEEYYTVSGQMLKPHKNEFLTVYRFVVGMKVGLKQDKGKCPATTSDGDINTLLPSI